MNSSFKEIREIGRGGFGRAVLAELTDGKVVVVKEVNLNTFNADKHLVKLINQEAALMAKLSHEHIVQMFEAFTDDTNMFRLVIEYCPGGDLQSQIDKMRRRVERFPEQLIAQWTGQLVETLHYLHKQHVLHRDIKANNVFLTADKQSIKLGDFGIAKVVSQTAEGGTTRISTPLYESPEFCQGEAYTAKSEAWSLGVLVYNLADLDLPFRCHGNNLVALALAIAKNEPRPLPKQYSQRMRDFVVGLLEKDKLKRLTIADALDHPFLTDKSSDEVKVEFSAQKAIEAAELGDEEFFKKIVHFNQLSSVITNDSTGDNLLHRACRFGHERIVAFLLKHSVVDANARNRHGDCPLHLASARGYENIIRILAGFGVNLNTLGSGGDNLRQLAAFTSENFYNVCVKDFKSGFQETALHTAVKFQNMYVVATLLDHGANINAYNSFLNTAIHVAAQCGRVDCLKLLLQRGADIEKKGRFGRTPLHYAALNNSLQAIELLLHHGASVNVSQLDDGWTPLHSAAYWGHDDVARLLLSNGADVTKMTSFGKTPAHIAQDRNNMSTRRLLLENTKR